MEFGKDDVIVVNEQDEWVGTMEKMEAHRSGVLHRAFSVFVLNDKPACPAGRHELLLQQRADGKYHSGGLWSNTCCSHPIPHESTMAAAHRRLQEEMGFDCELEPVFTMKYKADVGNGLTEHEFDHIYLGYYKGEIHANPEEVKAYEYMPLDVLLGRMKERPELYTAWLHLALGQFMEHLGRRKERV